MSYFKNLTIAFLGIFFFISICANAQKNNLKKDSLQIVKKDSLKKRDSINTSLLKDYSTKIKQIELLRINDSLKKIELEDKLNSLKTTDNIQKEELLKQLHNLKDQENQRISDKKAKIASLKKNAKGFPVNGFFKDTLFIIYSRLGSFSASDRAEAISGRIKKLTDNKFKNTSLKIIAIETIIDIVDTEKIILSISDNDAIWNNTTKEDLAINYKKIIENAVLNYKKETSLTTLLKEIGLALLVIVIFLFLIKYSVKLFKWSAKKILEQENKKIKGFKIKTYTLFDAKSLVKFIISINTILKWVFIILLIYIALPIIFGFFPWTKNFAETLFGYFLNPLKNILSVFLGFLFTFGSAGSLSNIIAGIVLTYMRLFKIGDRVKIGEVFGDVIEKSMLVTRVKTIKNEIISIPNSTVMSSHTINYSNESETGQGLILHTTITIGYDVPWKLMHETLLKAASRTNLLLKEPNPFVLQTSLDDFYVSYQINAYTKNPNKQAGIYSDLHQNIQDCCNEVGIEILSPHYRAARDGNMVTIPANYLDKNYKAPSFNVNIHKEENK